MMNIDECMDEHLAAKAEKEEDRLALKAAQEAGAYLRHMEEQNLVREARRAAEKPIWDGIVDEINNPTGPHKAHAAVYNNGSPLVDGVNVSCMVKFEQTWSKGHGMFNRGSKAIGQRLVIGNYGERVNYPQRKDGSFNYEAIARTLVAYAVKKNAEAAAQRNKAVNANEAALLCAEFGLKSYTSFVSPSSVPDRPVQVKFEINRAMTVDGARALYAALKALGIAPTY